MLIVGLGNPGAEYEGTRHNIGFAVVAELAARSGGAQFRRRFHGEFVEAPLANKSVGLLRPLTFMNDSGRSVQAAAAFYEYEPGDVLVIHDELDLPFADLKLKLGGGDGGHRGLRSVAAALGPDYARLRVGIGRPPLGFGGTPADFVLRAFASSEQAAVSTLVGKAADAAELVVGGGIAAAMNQINRR
jgi:PTH1 family peptidyl-tRNA hydrolase